MCPLPVFVQAADENNMLIKYFNSALIEPGVPGIPAK